MQTKIIILIVLTFTLFPPSMAWAYDEHRWSFPDIPGWNSINPQILQRELAKNSNFLPKTQQLKNNIPTVSVIYEKGRGFNLFGGHTGIRIDNKIYDIHKLN